MKRFPIILCGFWLLLGFVSQSFAVPIGFAVRSDGNDKLYSIDLANGDATAIGSGVGFRDVEGLGFNPLTGVLYGIDDKTDSLITINTTTGVGALVGSLGLSTKISHPGFAISYSGVGYMSEDKGTDELYSVNLGSGKATLIGSTGVNLDGLAFIGDTLYGVLADGQSYNNDALYTVDTNTGVVTLVGLLGTTFEYEAGLASDGVNLWAVDDNNPGRLLKINPQTGVAVQTLTTIDDFEGLAINQPIPNPFPDLTQASEPVPEPATVALLGTGLAGLAGAEVRRRRKKKVVDKSQVITRCSISGDEHRRLPKNSD